MGAMVKVENKKNLHDLVPKAESKIRDIKI
jgi:hypothetical protein